MKVSVAGRRKAEDEDGADSEVMARRGEAEAEDSAARDIEDKGEEKGGVGARVAAMASAEEGAAVEVEAGHHPSASPVPPHSLPNMAYMKEFSSYLMSLIL